MAGIPQMTYCVGVEIFGTPLIAGIGTIIIISYLLHKTQVSATFSIPIILLASMSMFFIFAYDIFQTIVLIILFFAALILAIVLIRHFYRS
jgi:hypothetical protein